MYKKHLKIINYKSTTENENVVINQWLTQIDCNQKKKKKYGINNSYVSNTHLLTAKL